MHVRAVAPRCKRAAAMAARAPRRVIARLTDAERDAHRAFVATLGADALWRAYLGGTELTGSASLLPQRRGPLSGRRVAWPARP